VSAQGWYERERLHFAAQEGDLTTVARLIAEGHDINAFVDLGKTALHWAAEKEHLDVATFLIEHGADVNARHEQSIGDTALGEVAGNCSLEMARLLVEAGADPSICGWMNLNALDRAKKRKRGDGPQVYALLMEATRRRGR
jgi:ankyrin repeat protein